jgi:hypothetical protein
MNMVNPKKLKIHLDSSLRHRQRGNALPEYAVLLGVLALSSVIVIRAFALNSKEQIITSLEYAQLTGTSTNNNSLLGGHQNPKAGGGTSGSSEGADEDGSDNGDDGE